MGVYVRHLSSLEHDPTERLAEHPDTPERIAAIEQEMASLDWLGFNVLDAPVVTNAALETADFAQMACHVRDLASSVGAPVGAVLEGGHDLVALADCVVATLKALSGAGETESIAPDPILTSRAAAQFGRYWRL